MKNSAVKRALPSVDPAAIEVVAGDQLPMGSQLAAGSALRDRLPGCSADFGAKPGTGPTP